MGKRLVESDPRLSIGDWRHSKKPKKGPGRPLKPNVYGFALFSALAHRALKGADFEEELLKIGITREEKLELAEIAQGYINILKDV